MVAFRFWAQDRSMEVCVPLDVTSGFGSGKAHRSAVQNGFHDADCCKLGSEDCISMSLCLCFRDRFPRLSSAAHLLAWTIGKASRASRSERAHRAESARLQPCYQMAPRPG
jgi:hypothetical protein